METGTKKSKEETEKWEDLWTKAQAEKWNWDSLSETIYQIFPKGKADSEGKLILEAGSGTGRISLRLKQEKKGEVLLLDISKAALKTSKEIFNTADQTGFFVLDSIFKMPIRDNSVDIVWNAGVLEHFSDHEKNLALTEMARTCRKNGLLITCNPYSKAILYRIGKWIAEIRHVWIYGHEEPIKSLTKYAVKDCVWISEYPADFDTSINFLRSIPYLRNIVPKLHRVFERLPSGMLDPFGYLLVSIAIKNG